MATSTIDSSLPPLTAVYPPSKPDISRESSQTRALISHLNMQPHIEGGYFVETDRDALRVPNPFLGKQSERGRNKEHERENEREATQERERDNTRSRERKKEKHRIPKKRQIPTKHHLVEKETTELTSRANRPNRHLQQRNQADPRSKHLNPLPPNPLLPTRSLPSQPRPNSPHPAQRPGPLRDNPRGRSRSSLPTRWLQSLHIILNRRGRQ